MVIVQSEKTSENKKIYDLQTIGLYKVKIKA